MKAKAIDHGSDKRCTCRECPKGTDDMFWRQDEEVACEKRYKMKKQPKWKLGAPMPKKAPKKGYKWVQNLLTQKWIQIAKDTPYCCDPSMERYWSM